MSTADDFNVGPLADRGDIRRRRHLGVRQIETEHVVELQRQLLVVQDRRHVDAVGHLEHEADEGRLHRGADPDRRLLLCGGDRQLRAKRPLGGPRPRRQFANDFGGKRRRRTGPAIGQEIDEDPLARRHGVDGRPPRQRQPDRGAVRIAPRGTDIVGDRVRQFIDGNIHRALEVDDDDRARGRHLGLDVLGKPEHQPGEAAGGGKRRLAPHRVVGAAGHRERQAGQQQDKAKATVQATASRPRQCAARRPSSSGSPSPHPGNLLASTNSLAKRARPRLNLGLAGLRFC